MSSIISSIYYSHRISFLLTHKLYVFVWYTCVDLAILRYLGHVKNIDDDDDDDV